MVKGMKKKAIIPILLFVVFAFGALATCKA
jgi:hypothetical protein